MAIYKSDCALLLKEMFDYWTPGDSLVHGDRKLFLAACSAKFDMNGLTEGALWTRLKKANVVKVAYTHDKQEFPDKPPKQISEFEEGGEPEPAIPKSGAVIAVPPTQIPFIEQFKTHQADTSAIELSLARIELLLKALVQLWETVDSPAGG